jgi:hypothetical protein
LPWSGKEDKFLRNALIFSSLYICMNVGILLLQEILTNSTRNTISKLNEECNNESDIDKKIQLFYKIHTMLPEQYQPNIPSLITCTKLSIEDYNRFEKYTSLAYQEGMI